MKNQDREQVFEKAHEDQVCPGCGMSKSEWKENRGEGYAKDGENYCCRGCAEGTGCTCSDE